MREVGYNRAAAVEYAHKWAFSRNPKYFNFDNLGGDCTNFASQVLYAGCGVMNFTPDTGWYFISTRKRAPAWTGVEFFYRFLTQNKGVGPYGKVVDASRVLPGDFVQLSFDGRRYGHNPVIVATGNPPTVNNILVAAHTYDADNRPLNTYSYDNLRFIHILGCRNH